MLAVHPDHNQGDSGRFVQVQRAYENLIKHRGEDTPGGQDSWNFHDWCAAAAAGQTLQSFRSRFKRRDVAGIWRTVTHPLSVTPKF